MPDRRINFGADATEATYAMGDDDPAGGGNFVLVEDLGGDVRLLEWVPAESSFEVRGTVEMNGESLAGVGSLNGADIAGAAEGEVLVAQGDGALAAEPLREGPNPYDAAQTFEEGELDVFHDGTKVESGSLVLPDKIAVIEGMNREFTDTGAKSGIEFTPSETVYALSLTRMDGGSKATDGWELVRTSDSQIVASDTSPIPAGASFTVGAVMQSGTTYRIQLVDSTGFSVANGFLSNSGLSDLPTSGGGITVEQSFIDNSTFTSRMYVFTDIFVGTDVGSVSLEWPTPTDLYEWDVATYTRTLDSETVDVFVAYSSDGGSTWTRTNGGSPIDRNYDLEGDPNITPDTDVRIEAELARADTANNPTLDSAYRSWFV